MASLSEHTDGELEKSGEGDRVSATVRKLVAVLEDHGGNAGETSRVVDMVARLARRQPLSPLTRHPFEWNDVSAAFGGEPMWQSARDPRAFSTDRGRTYTYEDDPGETRHRSAVPPGWVQALCEKHRGMSYQDALDAVLAYFDTEMTEEDVLILDTAGSARSRAEYMQRRFPAETILVANLLYEPLDEPAAAQVVSLNRVTHLAA